MTYEISIQDVKDYVTSLESDQEVGTPWAGKGCLLANTLKHKYPDAEDVEAYCYNYLAYVDGERIVVGDDVRAAGDKFEELPSRQAVTRSALEDHMPELFS